MENEDFMILRSRFKTSWSNGNKEQAVGFVVSFFRRHEVVFDSQNNLLHQWLGQKCLDVPQIIVMVYKLCLRTETVSFFFSPTTTSKLAEITSSGGTQGFETAVATAGLSAKLDVD